ncbi:ribonuclease 3-like protein 2 isoform X1 [Eucalyptus grandis]|uniref:ribonuclease 3-like protein 2 isoform X1 n=1 Tax=Eucalyptus grandis TaxID=71139 RepID=UPI00192E7BC6|nr:ribonuclease 3-like protein 2 isoform X1 [Eucalyptus grandis]XP_039171716.1 ribonuclease 3-like protein 2 isoform X1 [Eucalyptus grandis]
MSDKASKSSSWPHYFWYFSKEMKCQMPIFSFFTNCWCSLFLFLSAEISCGTILLMSVLLTCRVVVSDPQQYVCTVEIVTGDGVPYSVKGEKRSSRREAERCAAYHLFLALNDQAQKRQRDEEMFSPTSLPSLSPERGPSVSQVEAILRYKFEDPKLLEEALTLSSIPDAPSYERLAFVGDCVLNLAVSDHLVQAYPELDQGQLSTLLSANVCKEKLAQVALRCKLYSFLSHKMQYSNDQVSEFARAVEENGGSVEAPKFLQILLNLW